MIIVIIIIIIIIIMLFVIMFTQGIYNYISETNQVPTVYTVAAILSLQYMVHIMLFPMIKLLYIVLSISTIRSLCAVLSAANFFSSLMSFFPGISFRYFLNDCDMIPVIPVVTVITVVFTFHVHSIRAVVVVS